jgi:hypothetical protein
VQPVVNLDLSSNTRFLADIQERALALLTNQSFIRDVVAKVCAQVVDENSNADDETIKYRVAQKSLYREKI